MTWFENGIAESMVPLHQKFHTESVLTHQQLFGDQESLEDGEGRTQFRTHNLFLK